MKTKTIEKLLDKGYRGIDSVEIYKAVFDDAEVWHLMRNILLITYEKYLGQKGLSFCQSYFQEMMNLTHDCCLNEIKQVVLRSRNKFQQSDLNKYYVEDYRKLNLLKSLTIADINSFNGTVIDVGAGDNMLGYVLKKNSSNAARIIGVDIVKSKSIAIDTDLEFRIQTDQSVIPVANNEADTVVLRYALHHMSYEDQLKILDEIKRILKKNGTLIIYENTYSHNLEPRDKDEYYLHKKILYLKNPMRIKLLISVLDIFSEGIKDKHGPFPFTFRTVEEWLNLFKQKQYEIFDLIYYGMPIYDLHQAPLCIFILKHKKT